MRRWRLRVDVVAWRMSRIKATANFFFSVLVLDGLRAGSGQCLLESSKPQTQDGARLDVLLHVSHGPLGAGDWTWKVAMDNTTSGTRRWTGARDQRQRQQTRPASSSQPGQHGAGTIKIQSGCSILSMDGVGWRIVCNAG